MLEKSSGEILWRKPIKSSDLIGRIVERFSPEDRLQRIFPDAEKLSGDSSEEILCGANLSTHPSRAINLAILMVQKRNGPAAGPEFRSILKLVIATWNINIG